MINVRIHNYRVLSSNWNIYSYFLAAQGIELKMGRKECESQGLGKSCEMLSSEQDRLCTHELKVENGHSHKIKPTVPGNIVAGSPRLRRLQNIEERARR